MKNENNCCGGNCNTSQEKINIEHLELTSGSTWKYVSTSNEKNCGCGSGEKESGSCCGSNKEEKNSCGCDCNCDC